MPISNTARDKIQRYLEERRSARSGEETVFLNNRGGQLTRVMVFTISRAGRRARGHRQAHQSPYLPPPVRHTPARRRRQHTSRYRRCWDTSILTTEIYTHLDSDHLRRTLEEHLPISRRESGGKGGCGRPDRVRPHTYTQTEPPFARTNHSQKQRSRGSNPGFVVLRRRSVIRPARSHRQEYWPGGCSTIRRGTPRPDRVCRHAPSDSRPRHTRGRKSRGGKSRLVGDGRHFGTRHDDLAAVVEDRDIGFRFERRSAPVSTALPS